MFRRNRPPRVAIIGTRGYPSYYGGFETAVRALAPYLADNGWTVEVYGRKKWLKLDDSGRDVRVRSIQTLGLDTSSLSTLTYGLTSAVVCMFRRPDVVLIMNVANGFWLPLFRMFGVPTVVNVDGIEWERAKWGRAARAVFKTGATLTARFAGHLVFDAHAIGDVWLASYGRTGTMLPYGAAMPSDELGPVDDLVAGSYVLVVARFVPENTLGEFLDAVPTILMNTDLTVVLVGSGAPASELQSRVEALAVHPRIRYLGHVSDDARLFSLWKHASSYFHGHSVGGTNPALVQAMACGAPVIARDTVYNREVLTAEGAQFVPADPDAIAACVEQVHNDPATRERRASVARLRVQSQYNWPAVCAGYERLLAGHMRRSNAS